jgi:hypothetical protein
LEDVSANMGCVFGVDYAEAEGLLPAAHPPSAPNFMEIIAIKSVSG